MPSKEKASILIVDDDRDILLTARMVLKSRFSDIETENDPHRLGDLLGEKRYDLVLLDMNFTAGFTSGKEGLRWLKKIRKQAPHARVVLMTAYGDINLAVKAMKEGATDFVVKPWDNDQLQETISNALNGPPKPESSLLRASKPTPDKAWEMIGKSPAMQEVMSIISKVAATEANVLLLGENGTGKEVAARAIHQQSDRASGPFIHVDLGAISESLFESELFGHVRGAFTDAREDRAGRFEAAQGGTLFLDEIGNLSLPLQAKLLTALQNRAIYRVGSNQPVAIDTRLICATNMPIHQMVTDKTFRQDLLYRINTVELTLPPLREREGDIEILARHFLKIYADRYRLETISLDESLLKKMAAYPWPGNIRELQHAVERAVIMEDNSHLLPEAASPTPSSDQKAPEEDINLEEVEKQAIRKAISKHNGNLSKAARELGLGRTTLYRKMNKYGL